MVVFFFIWFTGREGVKFEIKVCWKFLETSIFLLFFNFWAEHETRFFGFYQVRDKSKILPQNLSFNTID